MSELKDKRLLLVEDDETLVAGLAEAFRLDGMIVTPVGRIDEATEEVFGGEEFDIIILDLVLPDGSGYDFLTELRRKNIDIPVLILSAKSSEIDKVVGLESGADDFLVKPFSLRELSARINAVLRRTSKRPRTKEDISVYSIRDFRIDFGAREVFVGRKRINLSYTEFQILKTLVTNKNLVIERATLLDRIWDGVFIDTKSIDPHISRLRKKIAPFGKMIETVPNVGYRFTEKN